MNKTSNIAILIPAAGSSSRMGRPKQLLKWKNSTLLGHTIERAKQLQGKGIFLVLGSDFDVISRSVDESDIVLLNHADWRAGLGSSIALGIKHLLGIKFDVDGVLIMLPDQPLIDIEHMKVMMDQFSKGRDQIIATNYGNNKSGVPVLFDRAYFDELGELNNDQGAKYMLKKHSKNVHTLGNTQLITDIDTMADYEALYRVNHQ